MFSRPVKKTASALEEYFDREFSQSDAGYYVGEGNEERSAGVWFGEVAERLGLSGNVTRTDFVSLANGKSPDGSRIVRVQSGEGRAERVAGWDFTMNAPKGFSILYAVGGDDRILQIHRRANDAALRIVEEAARVRGGENRDLNLKSNGIAAALFEHLESRELDPMLHTHAVIYNVTFSPYANDFRALQTLEMFRIRQLATQVYRGELARGAREAGYEIYWDKEGAPQPVGINKDAIDAFSIRRAKIEEYEAVEVARLESMGKTVSWDERIRIRNRGAFLTRPEKEQNIDRGELVREWRSRADSLGLNLDGLIEESKERSRRVSTDDLEGLRIEAVGKSVDFAVNHLTERNAVVKQREIETTIFGNYRFLELVDIKSIRAELDERVEKGGLLRESSNEDNPVYTTPELQRLEREMLGWIRAGLGKVEPVGTNEEIENAILEPMKGSGFTLSAEQERVFNFLMRTEDQFVGVRGSAGAGKSKIIEKMKEFAEERGYAVRSYAPTIQAKEVLNRDGLKAETIQAHLRKGDATDDMTGSRRQEIWVVDESSMVGTRDFHDVLEKARAKYARVIFIGDMDQFSSVPFGRAFGQALEKTMPSVEIDKIVRQRNAPVEVRDAVRLFRDRKVSEAMDLLRSAGRVHEAELMGTGKEVERDLLGLYKRVADQYVKEKGEVLVVTATNEERKTMNEWIRRNLQEKGVVERNGFTTEIFVNRNTTGAERKQAGSYGKGDVIRFEKVKHESLRKGIWYEVVDRDLGSNGLKVREWGSGKGKTTEIMYDPERHYGIEDIFKVESREFSSGDRIQFRGRTKEGSIKSGDLGHIIAIDNEGKALIEVNGVTVGIDLRTMKTLDLGYASTGYSAQGRTVDAVLVLMVSKHREEVMNFAAAYVGASRTRNELQVFVDDYERAVAAVSREYMKDAALDLKADPTMEEIKKMRVIKEMISLKGNLHGFGEDEAVRYPDRFKRRLLEYDLEVLEDEKSKLELRLEGIRKASRVGGVAVPIEVLTDTVSTLSSSDLAKLHESRISPELARKAGIRRVTSGEAAEIVGRSAKDGKYYAGLIFPYKDPTTGRISAERLRRDEPDYEFRDGKKKEEGKYLSAPGRSNRFYFPPETTAEQLQNREIMVVITEGEKKALSLKQFLEDTGKEGVTIGLAGVWSWKGKIGRAPAEDGGFTDIKGPIGDFDKVNWENRRVVIVFDSNVHANKQVGAARNALAEELSDRGARVEFVDIPSGMKGINGIDDVLGRLGVDYAEKLFKNSSPAKIRKRKSKQVVYDDLVTDALSSVTKQEIHSRRDEFPRTPSEISVDRATMHKRELLGQELVASLELRGLTRTREELISQARFRRYSVGEVDRSSLDIGQMARIQARSAAGKLGLKGEEADSFRRNFLDDAKRAEVDALSRIDEGFRKALGRVETEIEKRVATLESIKPLTDKVRAEEKSVPMPFLDRMQLDGLNESACRGKDVETIRLLRAIREHQAGEFARPEHTVESAGRLEAQWRIAEVGLRTAEKRLIDFNKGFKFWNWNVNGEEWSLKQIEKKAERLERERIRLERGGESPDGRKKNGEEHAAVVEIRSEILRQVDVQRRNLEFLVREAKELVDVLSEMRGRVADNLSPRFTGWELVSLERAAGFLDDPTLIGEFEREARAFSARENARRTEYTKLETDSLAARAEARQIIAGIEFEKAEKAFLGFKALHGGEPDFFVPEGDAITELEGMRHREILGREFVLNLQVRDLTRLRDALVKQAEQRRFTVSDEGSSRDSSISDIEQRAKTAGRAIAERLGLKGDERKKIKDQVADSEMRKDREAVGLIEGKTREKILELTDRLNELEGARELASLEAGAIRKVEGIGLLPYVGRSTLDALADRAISGRDPESLKLIVEMRKTLAAEFGKEGYTEQGKSRLVAQLRVSEVNLEVMERRLKDFENAKKFRTWDLEGREVSLFEIQREILRLTEDRFREERTDGKKSAEIQAALSHGERMREAVQARIEGERERLMGEIQGETQLVELLRKECATHSSGRLPEYRGGELRSLEKAAAYLQSATLLEEFEVEQAGYVGRENRIRTENTRINEEDLAARASARGVLAELDVKEATLSLREHVIRHGQLNDFVSLTNQPEEGLKRLMAAEKLGKELILDMQINDLEKAYVSLVEQLMMRRFTVSDGGMRRETSVFDLERAARAEARVEAERLELKGEAKTTTLRHAKAREMLESHSKVVEIGLEAGERIEAMARRLDRLHAMKEEASAESRRIRDEFEKRDESVPAPYVGRDTLTVLTEAAIGNRGVDDVELLLALRKSEADLFKAEPFTEAERERFAALTRMEEVRLAEARARLENFEKSHSFWTWKVGEREWSLNEVERVMDRRSEESAKYEAAVTIIEEELEGRRFFRSKLEGDLAELARESERRKVELREFVGVREEIRNRIDETRSSLKEDVENHARLAETLRIAEADWEETMPRKFSGIELASMEQAAESLKNADLLREYEANVRTHVERENQERTLETRIDRHDLAGRAVARTEIAEIRVAKAISTLTAFETHRDRTDVVLDDGRKTNLQELKPRSRTGLFAQYLAETLNDVEIDRPKARLEFALAEKVASVLRKAETELASREGFVAEFSKAVVRRVEESLAEKPEDFAKRLDVAKEIERRERDLKAEVLNAVAYRDAAREARADYERELRDTGREVKALFTSRDAATLEVEGISRGDETLRERGVHGAVQALELKEAHGGAHPLLRKAQYLPEHVEPRIQYEPIRTGTERILLVNDVERAEAFERATRSVRQGIEERLVSTGKSQAAPLFETGEGVRLERLGIAWNDLELKEKGVGAARTAHELKEARGAVSPLERTGEYVETTPYRPRVEMNPIERSVERESLIRNINGKKLYLEESKKVAETHAIDLEQTGGKRPGPLFTAAEGVKIEQYGESTGNGELRDYGLRVLMEAHKRKEEFGADHPMTERAEYEVGTIEKPAATRAVDVAVDGNMENEMAEVMDLHKLCEKFNVGQQAAEERFRVIFGERWSREPHRCLLEAEAAWTRKQPGQTVEHVQPLGPANSRPGIQAPPQHEKGTNFSGVQVRSLN